MAAFLHWVWQQSNTLKALLLSLTLIMGGVGLYLNEQYSRGYIHYDSMSGANYWQLFRHGNNPEFFKEHLKHPDYEKALHNGDR
ncbi:MAG: hypothetical protein U5L96_15750 [Owenweeksia sp.]|nr:hypothetical protein [Owenweeksia sp.]